MGVMKKQLPKVFLWSLLFFYIYSPMQDAALKNDLRELYLFLFDRNEALLTLTTATPFILYSLMAYLIFYYSYPRIPVWGSILLGVIPALFIIGIRYCLQEIFLRWAFGFGNYREGYPIKIYIIDNLYYAFLFSSFGAALYFVRYARFRRDRAQALEIENNRMQLSLLRAQINPHFLFNALNGIYALVNERSDRALPAIETLSKALRYSLYEQAERVPLRREWTFVQDYIRLQEMRLPHPPALLVEVPDPLPELYIPPFILTTFIENAFKHGELEAIDHPVRIKMAVDRQVFMFSVSNLIKKQNKDNTGGIGLENVQKRLDLTYGEQHRLQVNTSPDQIFSITLQIPLALCSAA